MFRIFLVCHLILVSEFKQQLHVKLVPYTTTVLSISSLVVLSFELLFSDGLLE